MAEENVVLDSDYIMLQCIAADSKDLAPWLNELSAQSFAQLVNVSDPSYNQNLSQGYWHINPKELLRQKKGQVIEDPTEIYNWAYKETEFNNPSSDFIVKACYTMQITWRRGRADLLNYFSLREHYDNTHPFEIGYLTHVIVSKYMNVLELYEMIVERYLKWPTKKYAPLAWMWYIYLNILDSTRYIIHWCNMMHELMKKYGAESGTSKAGPDYEEMSTPDPEEMEIDKYKKNIHDSYLAALAAKKKKQLKARLHYKYEMRHPSRNLTTTRTKRPPRFWRWRTGTAGRGKDYGWSYEDFFTNYYS